jgi:hypothetical protein
MSNSNNNNTNPNLNIQSPESFFMSQSSETVQSSLSDDKIVQQRSEEQSSNDQNLPMDIEKGKFDFQHLGVETLKIYLDEKIGYWWWKYYITTAFWSNFSTPINLSITLLSAITTGQVTANAYMSNNIFLIINVSVLVLTSLNSFFRPLEQYKQSVEFLKEWYKIGNDFEDVFLTKYDNDNDKCLEYKKIKDKMNKLIEEHEKYRNFFIDLLHLFITPTEKKNGTNLLQKNKKSPISLSNSVKAPRRALGYLTIPTFYGWYGYPILLEFVFTPILLWSFTSFHIAFEYLLDVLTSILVTIDAPLPLIFHLIC